VRAVTVTQAGLEVADRPVPAPSPGEVLVRVHGAGLNRADLLQAAGRYPAPPGSPPDIPGLEWAGTVERLGPGVDHPGVGARVMGIAGGGGQAEYVVVPARHCAPVPDAIDLVVAGGIPEAFVTAHDALVTRAGTRTGEWVLVHAAGSGVGTAAIQLATALGARVVGTARTPAKLARGEELGLHTGIVAPRTADGALDGDALAATVVAATGGAGVDVALDLVGGPYVDVDLASAASGGRIVLIGTLAGGRASLPILTVMGKRLTIVGTVLRTRSVAEKAEATATFTRDVVPLLTSGRVAPPVEAIVPLADAGAAYELLASDATFGKVILDCVSRG
jgi:putative PIG3 family NAD(P)H quinone oxidoreductase